MSDDIVTDSSSVNVLDVHAIASGLNGAPAASDSYIAIQEQLIPIHSIVREPAFMMRVALNDATVKKYAAAMAAGALFPPINIVEVDKRLLLTGGFHRTAAMELNGGSAILAHVRPGTMEQAILAAARAGAHEGLKRTNEDKHKVVEALLAIEWGKTNSDHMVAEAAGVSQPFVTKLRHRSTDNGYQLPPMRKGKDGKIRSAQRRKSSFATPPESSNSANIAPDAPNHASSDAEGRPGADPAATAAVRKAQYAMLESADGAAGDERGGHGGGGRGDDHGGNHDYDDCGGDDLDGLSGRKKPTAAQLIDAFKRRMTFIWKQADRKTREALIEYLKQLAGTIETPPPDRLRILADTLANHTNDEILAALPAKVKDAIVERAVNLERAHVVEKNRVLMKFIEGVILATRTNEDVAAKYEHIERLTRRFNSNGDVFTTHRMDLEASGFIKNRPDQTIGPVPKSGKPGKKLAAHDARPAPAAPASNSDDLEIPLYLRREPPRRLN